MLIFSYTGAQRHKLPTGHPSQQTIGAHILPRCSRHRRPLVLPIVRPTRSRLNRMFDNILRGLVVEFRTQHSGLRYASGRMLGQSEDFQIYSYKWYRRPYMFNGHIVRRNPSLRLGNSFFVDINQIRLYGEIEILVIYVRSEVDVQASVSNLLGIHL